MSNKQSKSWYESISNISSLGSQAARPGSLAGLHEARKEHLSQFFTSSTLAGFVWQIVEPAIDAAFAEDGRTVSLLDNSVGTGRMLQFADPERHSVAGIDVYEAAIDALNDAANDAGFSYDFVCGGMEDVRAYDFDVALINPPFSIHLESPNVDDYSCCTFGKFGPQTSATSHLYAVAQALDAASIVAAILPRSAVDAILNDETMNKRLVAIYDMPKNAFKEEGISVSTSVMVFDTFKRDLAKLERITVSDMSAPDFIPTLALSHGYRAPVRPLRKIGVTNEKPTITLPVTGTTDVKVGHDSRYISLGYQCGLTQAKVANAVLREVVSPKSGDTYHRYAKDMHFKGQGRLDIEVLIMQENPIGEFYELLNIIRRAGGNPVVDEGLFNFLEKRIRQFAIQSTPVRHSVWMAKGMVAKDADTITGVARKTHAAKKGDWVSPVIKKGASVDFKKVEDDDGLPTYLYKWNGINYALPAVDLFERFEVETGGSEGGWSVVHEGRIKAFPEHANTLIKKAEKLGIDKILSWTDYQFNDLIEACMDPKGSICGWKMGLGKARLAIALCMMGGQKNLIVVEPQLIDEMIIELNGLDLPIDSWKVIRSSEDVSDLCKINLISYNRLRMPINQSNKRLNIARLLRRRISTLVADEGHLLRNGYTQQSRALQMISAKKRYILSGTPISNYPRDIAALTAFAFGDGTAIQPYGMHKSFMDSRFILSTDYALRGIDAFREHFVCLEWVTNEFKENMEKGAKREIPKVKNVERFRRYLAPLVKRRLTNEPEVAKYISIPTPTTNLVLNSEWDDDHLGYYLKVADEFITWYKKEKDIADSRGKQLNLVALLARVQAVVRAVSFPQHGACGFVSYTGEMTSKQADALDDLEKLVADGHKTIFYATSPKVLDFMHKHLAERGIKSTLFHGEIDILERTKALDTEFRYGDFPILLASYGVTQKGLNIWQADTVYKFDRSWSATVEDQAAARVLRPQQTRDVEINARHLPGSMDDYQGQMVDYKRSAAGAGLDWGEQVENEDEFLHFDTILGRFCEEIALLKGCELGELREKLKSYA